MGKPVIVSMIFNNAQTIRAGLNQLKATTNPDDYRLVLLDQHYPLNYAATRAELDAIAKEFPHSQIVDPGTNLGLHIGLNHAINEAHALEPIADEDIVIGYDPDERPMTDTWFPAMTEVLRAEWTRPEGEKRCTWLSLTSVPARDYMLNAGYEKKDIAGHEVWKPHYALINHVCGWTMGAIRKVGAFTEPHAFYGGIEVAMQPRYADAGYWHGYLAQHMDSCFHDLIDPQYRKWKADHVSGAYAGDFASYLTLRMA